ncbi:hypothetical protein E2C01_032777 [Portunus trituberculatus]|uniref:Uncharacterized protein n=1 Tax=Portunus trituberculatus TaxID=210409 RepID=A0A5B7F198_PORTR|nr:hypothetical protein [Portunus trituberculatus]
MQSRGASEPRCSPFLKGDLKNNHPMNTKRWASLHIRRPFLPKQEKQLANGEVQSETAFICPNETLATDLIKGNYVRPPRGSLGCRGVSTPRA